MSTANERFEPPACPRCSTDSPGSRIYCTRCGQLLSADLNITMATWTDRGVAFLADALLFFLTLGIGWLIWTAALSVSQQTPGKKFADIRVYRKSGVPASQLRFLLRDVVLRSALFPPLLILQWGIFLVLILLNFLWPLADRSRQSPIDRLVDTVIVRPNDRWRGERADEGQFSAHLGHLTLRRRPSDRDRR